MRTAQKSSTVFVHMYDSLVAQYGRWGEDVFRTLEMLRMLEMCYLKRPVGHSLEWQRVSAVERSVRNSECE